MGPLPLDDGFDCIVTIMDRLGADIHVCWSIRVAPTHMNITTERFAAQSFDLWYCENGLLLDIVSDHDKLFISKFWKALCKMTGIHLKMSSAYHPETDGSSERSNKTIVQSL
jgi:hypothetical protein